MTAASIFSYHSWQEGGKNIEFQLIMRPNLCQSEAINTRRSCGLLTVIIMRRASIMPSIMYKLLVNPPAHKGPKMVARPPTERLTPWLNPVLFFF